MFYQGSSDSGKGGSDVATPPSRTPAGDSMPLTYEFTLPQVLVGKLIGRFGTFVAEIKEKTRSHIVIKKHPTVGKLKLCVIEGNIKKTFISTVLMLFWFFIL